MTAYLTSHTGGMYVRDGERFPAPLNTENGFLENLQKRWKDNARVLIISSDPEDIQKNDSFLNIFRQSLPMSGLSVGRMEICDSRNEALVRQLYSYDVVILAGGHVPDQNRFFERIGLRERIRDFEGILIGISAGTMNSAEVVYAQPELEGESMDETYERFLPGLGITDLMILPHYQQMKDAMLDGKRLFEDITYPDSFGRQFYALEDGSYLLLEKGETVLYGAAWLIEDGRLTQICKEGCSVRIR